MTLELPKKYDPQVEEPKLQKFWKDEDIYRFSPDSKDPVFSIDTPPPYASADHLHVGHGMHYSQFEFVARFQRMMGKNVFFPMGYDDNGLPTERFVEKKHKINKSKTTRKEFIDLCMKETKITGQTYYDLFTRLGFSIDWSLLYHTIGEKARRVSQRSFITLFNKGLMQRVDSPALWCTSCQTSIAQADLESADLSSAFNDIAFSCEGKELIISTTRPEMIPACVALFFNPEDGRYQSLKGKKAKVPLFDYEVPILTDEAVALDVGTGLMMVCTFGDKEDVEKWYKHNLDLRIVFTEDGRMNENAGKYKGLKIKEARKEIIEELKAQGALKDQKDITHAVNVHERCGTEIEFMKKPQWYINVLDHKDDLLKAADRVRWFPDHMKVRYQHWVQNLQWNWGISRQRYYGVPFPVWYCADCGKVLLPDIADLPVDPREEQYKGACSCGSTNIIPEMDVMDTWMTSSCTPEINNDWDKNNLLPMSLRPQAHDIIRTWAFYTITKSFYHREDIPWHDIMISGHGQDPHGQKMSKSKGNFVVAQDVIKQYSADAFRFWAASVKLGADLPYQEKDVVTGQKFITKLWNASKFSLMHLEDYNKTDPKLTDIFDRWIMSRLQRLIASCTESFETYEYSRTKRDVERFFWNEFCDQYLEVSKDRLYNPEARGKENRLSAQFALYENILATLKMMAPIMPHITESIYQMYFKDKENVRSIHLSRWPSHDASLIDEYAEKAAETALPIINAVRKFKSDNQVSLKKDISLTIQCSDEQRRMLEELMDDLKAVTRAAALNFGDAGMEIEGSDIRLDIGLI